VCMPPFLAASTAATPHLSHSADIVAKQDTNNE
jgi:hypothetical protein